MFDYDLDPEQELSEIPAEYQDAFRQALARELAESEQNRTDSDILTYLRRRRDDFKRGGFIRPDGRPGMVALNPETMYEQALPELAQSSLGDGDNSDERRRTLIKIGVFAALALIFLFLVLRGRAQRSVAAEVIEEEAATAAVSDADNPVPTPPLPEITGVDDSLQTIGSLGGALTIGRPGAIELSYSRTEETIALAIDPSNPTPKGELRFNQATMRSENPVAVWLFGTVLNYAVGIPDSMVRNLEPGDRITLSTDTGAALRFVVAERWQGSSYEAGRLLSQNRLGLTLFALPAAAENDVSFAFANYDVTSEETEAQEVYEVGESFSLGALGELTVAEVAFSHTAVGDIRIVVTGTTGSPAAGQSLVLSLSSRREQTTAVPLTPDEAGGWAAQFVLPDGATGEALSAEFRALPGGSLAVVQLGQLPALAEQLAVEITGAWWDVAAERAEVAVSVHNPGAGAVYLGGEFIQLPTDGLAIEGGDVYGPNGQAVPRLPEQVTPHLPLLIGPGETVGFTVPFRPHSASVRLQIGADLWALDGFPAEMLSE